MEGARKIYSLQGAAALGHQKVSQVITCSVIKDAVTRIQHVDLVNKSQLLAKMPRNGFLIIEIFEFVRLTQGKNCKTVRVFVLGATRIDSPLSVSRLLHLLKPDVSQRPPCV